MIFKDVDFDYIILYCFLSTVVIFDSFRSSVSSYDAVGYNLSGHNYVEKGLLQNDSHTKIVFREIKVAIWNFQTDRHEPEINGK